MVEYEVQIKHLLQIINSQRRLIQKLRADFQLIQVITDTAVAPVEDRSD